MFDYACEFELVVDDQNKIDPYHVRAVNSFISENFELWDIVDFSADFYFDDVRFEVLEDGVYKIYVRGKAEFESDVDWESGRDEGHFLLGIEVLRITKIEDIT